MKADTTLTLGDFTFARYEIPEHIPFGGAHRLTIHDRVGGARVIDAMGAMPDPIEWSGTFIGAQALQRALYLDGLRKAGKPLPLSWSELAFTVVIQSFHCAFKRFYRLPYRIVCEVVEDQTAPVEAIAAPDMDQVIGEDVQAANRDAKDIGNEPLSTLMGGLNQAIGTVSRFATLTQSALNTVLEPIAAVRAQVSVLLESAHGVIQNATTLGGLLPENPAAQHVNGLFSLTDALFQSARLIHLDRLLGRMQANIGGIHGHGKSMTVAGGNLYRIAAEEYGHAMDWTAIAQANGLTDPNLDGIQTLIIPPRAPSSGGVFNA